MPNIRSFPFSLYLIISVFLVSCRSKESDPLADFSSFKQERITGKEFKLASDSLLYLPFNFFVHDTIGVFNDNSGRTAVTLINMKTGGLIKKIVYSGGLPSEFDINSILINDVADNYNDFTVLQTNPPCKIIRYNWSKILQDTLYKPNPLFYPKKYGYANAILLSDSTIIGQLSSSKFDKKLFGITNMASKKLLTGLDIPRFNDKAFDHYYKDSTFYNIFKSVLDIKFRIRPNTTNEFAYFSRNGALFQIFKINENFKFETVKDKIYYLPLFNVVNTSNTIRSKMLPESRNGFGDVAVTNDKIYTLYIGSEKDQLFSDDVLVYDWNGNPVKRIKLGIKCRNITIDEKHPDVMYGMYGTTTVRIVKFNLPK